MIYLDNNATTRLDDVVIEHMTTVMKDNYANASSTQHKAGRSANSLVEKARQSIATLLNITPKEIIFTSGATESINLAIKGLYNRLQSFGKHIITCATEHSAVMSSCKQLEYIGADITYLPVKHDGQIDLELLDQSIRKDTILVCIMSCNNETGILHPIESISAICKSHHTPFFCDVTQSIGKEIINFNLVDYACFSAHKFHGPKGIGVLYSKNNNRGSQLTPLLSGGSQESGLRPGTYNTPAIVGMAKALEIALQTDRDTIMNLRDYMEDEIKRRIPEVHINGHDVSRIDNTSNIIFKHVRSSLLFSQLPNIALAAGSACITGDSEPSHVLTAMHMSKEDALCAVRFSLSKFNTKTEIDHMLDTLEKSIVQLRSESPTWALFKAGLL